jgi:hypothetical protein
VATYTGGVKIGGAGAGGGGPMSTGSCLSGWGVFSEAEIHGEYHGNILYLKLVGTSKYPKHSKTYVNLCQQTKSTNQKDCSETG